MPEPLLELRDLHHRYGNETALEGISFTVSAGTFLTLVGPSGCGKTTTLKCIAGLVQPRRGEIRVEGEDITRRSPRHRPCSLVFQSLALFPHMSVWDNIAYPLATLGIPRQDRERRIRDMLAMVDLPDSLLGRPPSQLSGGQRQRVALARSLVYEPKLLLLDEPLSAIDFQLRRQLRKMLSDLHRESGKTFLYVTHSLEEALSMSDHILVMNEGRIVQQGTPEDIFSQPANRFVAEFMGDANVFAVEVSDGPANGAQRYWAAELGRDVHVERHGSRRSGYLVLRAHEISLARQASQPNALPGQVFNRYDLGGSIEYSVALASGGDMRLSCLMEKSREAEFSPGEEVYAQWQPHAGTVVPE